MAPEYLTTKEVAGYLRIKERRVYELVRLGAIPCTRVTGKWLFPKHDIDQWLVAEAVPKGARPSPPPVIAGSHDPLLDWAVKESDCGLALLTQGSLDGLQRIADSSAAIAGLHLYDSASNSFNVPDLRTALPQAPVVLLQWAWREQGLILARGLGRSIASLKDLAASGKAVIARQPAAGSQRLFEHVLAQQQLSLADLTVLPGRALSETDLGLAILEERASAGFAIRAVAESLRLDFLPLAKERFDLLLYRREYFQPEFQKLLKFARSTAFQQRAAQMCGYDVSGLGEVRYNGP